ncbi:MAG: hypothetical protein CL484_03310 [Acidobacteria bacterium]|nr:hypothetical protein [Acidobacteriota bacterium]
MPAFPPHHLIRTTFLLATALTFAPPAKAQLQPAVSALPIGENYHIELMAGTWSPTPAMNVSSNAFGIAGTRINLTSDLGMTPDRFNDLRLRLRVARKHRFRIDYLPVNYATETTSKRRLIFRGIAYEAGLPVSSRMTWTTWRFGYEYDVIHRRHGYFGLILETKHTELHTGLSSPGNYEFIRAKGPVPALGAVIRVYPLQTLSLAAETTAFRLPNGLVDNYSGRYIDIDLYATINFIEAFGLQLGYRSLDLNLITSEDLADLRLEGMYLGALLRF